MANQDPDQAHPPADEVTLTIDGIEVTAPKGTLVIRVAEKLGIEIPRFCDHPLLAPAGACRQCLVEIEGQRKPVTSCTTPVTDGMVVHTQFTSATAKKAQAGQMEFLLINHPLDCPVCDKGGECPLQNQAMSTGRPDTRFHDRKRTYPKPIAISSQILLDRERCVLCQRCTRFAAEIAGDRFIDLLERGSAEQVGIDPAEPFNSYFSGNTVQICPVGALTGIQYRFRARPFDLVSKPSVCEHCAAGCALRTDWRRNTVLRRLAGADPQVNEEWNCDKGRWGFRYATAADRLTTPLIRDAGTGELREASWSEALSTAAEGLRAARDNTGDGARGVGVLTGGRLTVEDAYAYAKFARVVLRTNDVDFRARPLSSEETEFLAACVAGRADVTYAAVEAAPTAVVVGLEPEEECPILFLRLRKAAMKRGLRVYAVAPFLSRGCQKLAATLVPAVPGGEAKILADRRQVALREALAEPGAVLFVGERLASVPGGLSAAARLAAETGARLAWVPRRAGDRGAVDTGCLPNLLPGGRPVTDAAARTQMAAIWGLDPQALPAETGRDTDQIIAAADQGQLGALVVAGLDPGDLADPRAAERAFEKVGFLVSLELRASAVSQRADVVFPVAPVMEKAGSFVNWEGRLRTFGRVLPAPPAAAGDAGGAAQADARILDALAAQLGVALNTADVRAVRRELASLPPPQMPRPYPPVVEPAPAARPGRGESVLATWHQLIDSGSLLHGDEHLAGTARPPVVGLAKSTAEGLGVSDGDPVTVGTDRGTITLPALVSDLPDGVVWLPTNSPGSAVRRTLGVTAGALVTISAGGTR